MARSFALATQSLKLRVTLIAFVALSLGMGALLVLVVRQTEQDTLAAQQARQLAETARTASLLSRRIVDLQLALRAAAGSLDAGVLSRPDELENVIGVNSALRSLFASVFVARKDGRLLLLSEPGRPVHPDIVISDRRYFERTQAELRPIVSNGFWNRDNGGSSVVLTHPLQDESGIYGVLAGTLHLNKRNLVADLSDQKGNSASDLVIVTDAQGQILGHPDRSRLLHSLSEEPRLSQAYMAWIASGSAIEADGLQFYQDGQVVSAAGVESADWVVWRALPERELLAPLEAARKRALSLGAILLLAVSLLMFTVLAWLMRPLSRLERRARHLFDGKLNPQEQWPEAVGEIGRLSAVLQRVSTERMRLESYNDDLLQKLASVMNAAPLGLAFTRKGRFELVSSELCRMLGRIEGELLGKPLRTIFADPDDHALMTDRMDESLDASKPYVGDWRLTPGEGNVLWVKMRVRPVNWKDLDAGSVWTFNDITQLLVSREQLQWSATHDALTGLANRKLLEQRMARVFEAREAQPSSLPAVIVMVDLDRFKPINDEAGHAVGDEMLKAVAKAIAANVRATDLVARLGGDEFVLLLEHCNQQTATRLVEDIQVAIGEIELPWAGKRLGVGASIGLSELSADTESTTAWLEQADAACYQVKRDGRGAVAWAVAARR